MEEKLAQLETDYNGAVTKQDQLAHEMHMCEVKLGNAVKLIDGLGGEKDRWGETVERLTTEYELLPGDSILAAGMVSYAGAFVGEYREHFQNIWLKREELDYSI